MRVRVSRGWKVCERHGRFYLRGADLFVLPTVHEDQTFTVSLEPDEAAGAASGDTLLSLQVALLYTHSEGERRIRVHTVALPLTQNMQVRDDYMPDKNLEFLGRSSQCVCRGTQVHEGCMHASFKAFCVKCACG